MNKNILNCPIDYDKNDFFSLVSLSAGVMITRQLDMGELVIKNRGWNVDIKNGTIAFGEDIFPAGIIGTESEVSGTWLWGWANKTSGLPEKAAAPARRMKKLFADVPEFKNASFMLDELHSGHNISMVCCAASEDNCCYYRCPYDGGALFVRISELPDAVFEQPSPEKLAKVFLQVIGSIQCDHKLTAAGMLWAFGYEFKDCGDYITADTAYDTPIRFDFENVGELRRTVNLQFPHSE